MILTNNQEPIIVWVPEMDNSKKKLSDEKDKIIFSFGSDLGYGILR